MPVDSDIPDSTELSDIHQEALPTFLKRLQKPGAPILRKLSEMSIAPQMPEVKHPVAPIPENSVLAGVDWNKGNHFIVLEREEILSCEDVVDAAPEMPEWRIEDSVFAPRKQTCDSRDFYDHDATYSKMFERDWAYCTEKEKFKKFALGKDKGKGSEAALEQIKMAFKDNYAYMTNVFDYYSCMGSGNIFSMHLNEWGTLMVDCDIPESASTTCKLSHLDTVFIATNFEEDKGTNVADANLDDALMRFEFVEAIMRVAKLKFMRDAALLGSSHPPTFSTDSLEVAIRHLFEVQIEPRAVPEAKISRNHFRRHRLYNADVDELYKSYQRSLKVLYNFYKSHNKITATRYMEVVDWVRLNSDAMLFHSYYTLREAQLSFIWSRMYMINDMKNRNKACGLSFVDFLECLGRAADFISPPPVEEIIAAGFKGPHPTADYFRAMSSDGVALHADRPSANMGAPKTRPLTDKLCQVNQRAGNAFCGSRLLALDGGCVHLNGRVA
eukprot:evm.model.scf_352.3 EVM.evm.TU.scf_352.3   scf_352:73256-77230(+)